VIRTTVNQVKQPSIGPITFHPQFVYAFMMDASHIKTPPHWQRNEIVDADEIASPQVLGLKERFESQLQGARLIFPSFG
jgi:hypothetical protein